jgi:hypothetical protein
MGRAAVRTVVDPETGEEMQVMAFLNYGKVRYQRLRSFDERMRSAKSWENLARFGEASTKSYGTKMRPDGEPSAWRVIRREIPRHALTMPGAAEEDAAKQEGYAELLGDQLPGVRDELVLREVLHIPILASDEYRESLSSELEQRLRRRISTTKVPMLRPTGRP